MTPPKMITSSRACGRGVTYSTRAWRLTPCSGKLFRVVRSHMSDGVSCSAHRKPFQLGSPPTSSMWSFITAALCIAEGGGGMPGTSGRTQSTGSWPWPAAPSEPTCSS